MIPLGEEQQNAKMLEIDGKHPIDDTDLQIQSICQLMVIVRSLTNCPLELELEKINLSQAP